MRPFFLVALLLAVGCGGKDPDAPSVERDAGPAQAHAGQPAPQGGDPAMAAGEMLIVDLEGKPVANIVPIAANTPNAFEPPVARGEPSNAAGRTTIAFPADQHLYLRGWDVTQKLFANNYIEVLPDQPGWIEEQQLVMAPGATLRAKLVLPGGVPAANTPVRIMMAHPTEGPWWPAQGQTDADGFVVFPSVAPGQFDIRFTLPGGEHGVMPGVALPPGGHGDAGTVQLQ